MMPRSRLIPQDVATSLSQLQAIIAEDKRRDMIVIAEVARDAYYLGRIHERTGNVLAPEYEAYLKEVAERHGLEGVRDG
jgi:urease alpha subunit